MRKATKITGFLGSAALTAGLLGAAAAGTGAYFQDAEAGTITGTVGTIQINASNMDVAFDKVLPGEPQLRSAVVTNVGNRAQDLYIQFDNPEINALLQYASLQVNGVEVTGSGAVLLASGLGVGASQDIDLRLEVDSTVTEAVYPYVTQIANAELDFTVTATQPGQAPRS